MASTLDPQTAEAKARQLLDNRITSVRVLVTSRQTLADLRDRLTAAETDDATAYRAALADGWSADELRKLGLDEPEKKQRMRRRAAARTRHGARSAPNAKQGTVETGESGSVSP